MLAKPLQTNEHVLEKVPVDAMALTLFYFCDPSKLPVPFWQKKLLLAEVNSISPCSIQEFSPPSQKAAKVKSSLFHWFWTPEANRRANAKSRAVAAGKRCGCAGKRRENL